MLVIFMVMVWLLLALLMSCKIARLSLNIRIGCLSISYLG
jgi:hypothetical protein